MRDALFQHLPRLMSGARVCAPLETREGCERVEFDAQRAELLAIRVAPCRVRVVRVHLTSRQHARMAARGWIV